MSKRKKDRIDNIDQVPKIFSKILDHNSEHEDGLNHLLEGREREKKIIDRLDLYFRSYCTGPLGEYVTYEGYEKEPIAPKLNIRVVSTKETLSEKFIFKFKTKWYDPKKDETIYKDEEIVLDIPLPYKKHFMKINGHMYLAIYQLSDIIYKTKSSCVIKTLLTPVKLTRSDNPKRPYTSCDTKRVEFVAPFYTLDMFRKSTPFLAYFFAKMGVRKTFEYFGVEGMIGFVSVAAIPNNPNIVSFKMNKNVAVCVNKTAMNNTLFRSYIATLLKMGKRNMTIYDAYDDVYWKCYIGDMFARVQTQSTDPEIIAAETAVKIKKCDDTLRNLEKTIDDEDTSFHLGYYAGSLTETEDVYACMRWLYMNFSKLIHNDNLHVQNKRLRLNEYITIPLLKRIQDKKNSFLRNPDHMRLGDIFKVPQNIILKEGVENNGVSRYVGLVNDNIMLNVLTVTKSGPSAHGGSNNNERMSNKHTIPSDNLFVNPSELGVFDPNYAPPSSVGINSILTPGVRITEFGTIESMIGDENPSSPIDKIEDE